MAEDRDTDTLALTSDSARRLLAAAIRMYFAGEDELAVRVVASAAHGLVREAESIRGKDAGPDLVTQDIGNLPLLLLTHSAYAELADESVWPEGIVLWVYFNATEGTKEAVQEDFSEFVDSLEGLDSDQRLRFCSVWIEKLKQSTAPDGSRIH